MSDHTDPDHTDPDHTDPDHTDPDHTDPDHTDPDHTDPEPGNGSVDAAPVRVLMNGLGEPLPYADAIAELETILAALEASSVDIDTLATQVARATALIDHCRRRLVTVRSSVDRVLADSRWAEDHEPADD